MPILYPQGLPLGLHSGRSYQLVSPLKRSELANGRSIQRRAFTDVPEGASVSWLLSDVQSSAFIAWWRDALKDGVRWFEMPLDHPGAGKKNYTSRFTGPYSGPSRVGPDLWSISAELELKERVSVPKAWGNFPEFILQASIFDIAINEKWPLSPWQIHIEAADLAINQDWPKP